MLNIAHRLEISNTAVRKVGPFPSVDIWSSL
jgi:hypothetical protein